jgi:SAM-dependent methyltransferase
MPADAIGRTKGRMRPSPLPIGHTVRMHSVWFGRGVADDSELRLCGDVSGKRTLELGVGPTPPTITPNAVTLALAGAKSIAVDPSADRIASLRHRADEAEVRVECHQSELVELGFITSGSVDLVIATQTLDDIDDLPRLTRQVHRVLKPNAAFVMAITHPVAAMFDAGIAAPQHRYGETTRSISELYMSFERANFHIDVIHELAPLAARDATAPTVLLLRARKEGV